MRFSLVLLYGCSCAAMAALSAASIDFTNAVVVVRPGDRPSAEKTAAKVLIEELEKRSAVRLSESTIWPAGRPVIAITSVPGIPGWRREVPIRSGNGLPEIRAEGYRLFLDDRERGAPVLWIIGADARGTLFGVGNLLRKLDWAQGRIEITGPLDIATSPAYAIRGHQLGYRTQANSYDAWNAAQFEQYIRELTFFGVNSIENIPFQDERKTPVMKTPRDEMNRAMSDICDRYGLEYWVWVPADFDLKNTALRSQSLDRYKEFFRDTKQLTGVFFPGGDPGRNPPELVLPYLEDIAKLMQPGHPGARIWLSLQWFTAAQGDAVYAYLDREKPWWFAGLVAGPSGPPVDVTRARLPKQYKLRLYPDLTHNKLSQYQVPSWDQAYALTLGREAVNPRPAEYARIFHRTAPYSDGFLSYSDGVHDDVNKTVWSALSWDPNLSVRGILIDYARAYFDPAIAPSAADAILALENNWRGPLVDNGAVEGTLASWQALEKTAPRLQSNWRWQMCLLRANYDAYDRHRLLYETQLEAQANDVLARTASLGADVAMERAATILNRAATDRVTPQLRTRIIELCEKLFQSIGLQSSVEKYFASGEERGAVLDFVDYPLNNRWWLEDEFKKIRAMPSEADKRARLMTIATWEHPGPGSYYDDIGNIAKSPHVVGCTADASRPGLERQPEPTFWWWNEGKSRARLSWQVTMWPQSMVYEALDPKSTYLVRTTGYGQELLHMNGERVQPAIDGKQMGEFKEFPVDPKFIKDGKLVLTWDRPTDEASLNWRQKSRLSEVWLIKTTSP